MEGGYMLLFLRTRVNEQNGFGGELLLRVKEPQLCQCVYSVESGRLGAPVCGSPADSRPTLNKRISRNSGRAGTSAGRGGENGCPRQNV